MEDDIRPTIVENIVLLSDSFSKTIDALAWPICIIIMALIFKNAISNAISTLAARVKSLGLSSAIFNEPAQKSDNNEDKLKNSLEDVLENEPLIKSYLAWAEEEIKKGVKLTNLPEIAFLKAKVVELHIYFNFEKIYRVIYGSQIHLLMFMNSQTYTAKEEVEKFYLRAKLAFPNLYNQYSFNQWINYLKNELLVNENEHGYSITLEGKTFIIFITRQNYDINKLF